MSILWFRIHLLAIDKGLPLPDNAEIDIIPKTGKTHEI
jgi:hypothetical protein